MRIMKDDTQTEEKQPTQIAEQQAEYTATPPRTKVLKNGAIYSLDKGRIIGNPPGGTTNAITQAQAGAMANLRWEKVAQAQSYAIESIREVSATPTGLAAWGKLVGFRYERALDRKNTRGTEDARFVGHATGYLPLQRAEQDGAGGASVRIDIGQDALAALLDAVTGRREQLAGGDVIDVEGDDQD